jgi:hypothetical protein
MLLASGLARTFKKFFRISMTGEETDMLLKKELQLYI